MKLRRPLLVAILVYVTLDLSLPAMPGAFVFEPADSVESVGGGRVVVRVGVMPTLAATPVASVSLLPDHPPRRQPASGELPRLRCPRTRRLPRVTCGSPRPSEDPH